MKLTRRQRTLLSDVCADLAKAVIASYLFQLFIFTEYTRLIIILLTFISLLVSGGFLWIALLLRKD